MKAIVGNRDVDIEVARDGFPATSTRFGARLEAEEEVG
jgi:hypothetical protein